MAKRNSSKVSKKNFPGLKRVVIDGFRVWEYQGKNFNSLKKLDMSKNPTRHISMKFNPASKVEDIGEIVENLPVVNDMIDNTNFIYDEEDNKDTK